MRVIEAFIVALIKQPPLSGSRIQLSTHRLANAATAGGSHGSSRDVAMALEIAGMRTIAPEVARS
jgi:hypothetical protein